MASITIQTSDGSGSFSGYLVEPKAKPLIVHIADKDEFFPPEGRANVVVAVESLRQIACYVYPDADHAFARVRGVHWDGRSAAIANGRNAAALAAALG